MRLHRRVRSSSRCSGEPSWLHFQAELEIEETGTRAGLALAVDAASALVVWVDGKTALRIVGRQGSVETELGNVALSRQAPLTLAVIGYDDEIRARVGPVEIRVQRGQFRQGRLALAAVGAARFTALRVDGLDAYRLQFDVSRFDSFEAHISSFGGTMARIQSLVPPSLGIVDLLASRAPFAQWIQRSPSAARRGRKTGD